jgi:O-antigen/teichoic acid export membrane protein
MSRPYRHIVIWQALASLCSGGVVAALFVVDATPSQYALTLVLNSALWAWILIRSIAEPRSVSSASAHDFALRIKTLLSESWPFLINDLIFLATVRLDQIVLLHLTNAETLGYYAVAVRLTEITAFVPTLVARPLPLELLDDPRHRVNIDAMPAGAIQPVRV